VKNNAKEKKKKKIRVKQKQQLQLHKDTTIYKAKTTGNPDNQEKKPNTSILLNQIILLNTYFFEHT
jgi:hypothetical protein